LRPREKKIWEKLTEQYLDVALADFSGYLAIDEVYDGPFCVICVVDNRRYNRLSVRVLQQSPTQQLVGEFLAEFKEQLKRRGLTVRGITTDGSNLYPKALEELWPGTRHQICRFHVIKEITRAILNTLAALRKRLSAKIPKGRRGRPSKKERRGAASRKRQQQRVADLFEHRHLFVRRELTPGQRKELSRLIRGQAGLSRLREVMEEVYRLFDRRCKKETALRKLAQLRRGLRRTKSLSVALNKLKSPNLEKALEYLDDKLLPSTSNAVERSNRRFRKAQKGIYSARKKKRLEQRLALDMQREQQSKQRQQTLETLHKDRAEGEE